MNLEDRINKKNSVDGYGILERTVSRKERARSQKPEARGESRVKKQRSLYIKGKNKNSKGRVKQTPENPRMKSRYKRKTGCCNNDDADWSKRARRWNYFPDWVMVHGEFVVAQCLASAGEGRWGRSSVPEPWGLAYRVFVLCSAFFVFIGCCSLWGSRVDRRAFGDDPAEGRVRHGRSQTAEISTPKPQVTQISPLSFGILVN